MDRLFNVITFLIFFSLSSVSWADDILTCTFSKYKGDSWISADEVKSMIPEQSQHLIKSDKTAVLVGYDLEGLVSKNNSKRVEFKYEFNGLDMKYIYFRTNQKAVATLVVQAGQDYKVYGKCSEEKDTSKEYIRYTDASEKDVCGEVSIVLGDEGMSMGVTINNKDGTVQNQGWIDEAKRRWGADYVSHCANVLRPSQNSASSTTTTTSKLDKAKSTCTELGFTLGTEKHGECVLKMMDN